MEGSFQPNHPTAFLPLDSGRRWVLHLLEGSQTPPFYVRKLPSCLERRIMGAGGEGRGAGRRREEV